MIKQKITVQDLLQIKQDVKFKNPLIHCITNPISINDCANVVLVTGAKPIMAEHPLEVAEITSISSALAVNLGNITDARMESMLISGKVALENKIPQVIDLVGVACSKLRLNYAKKFISECTPNVIKGNMSEIKAIYGVKNNSKGIDVGLKDIINKNNIEENVKILKSLAKQTKAIVVATGVVDIITDGEDTYLIKNGCEMLSMITGTGCMLNTLIGSFISSKDILKGAILGTVLMGICGELSENDMGTGTFKTRLLDNMFNISDNTIIEKIIYELK
ncbi:hydroxyethylthiazole kinase [Clostridium novyi A str. 4552]|uniref:Hydroxyethylthiazole kinase n=1 Tax=Clostridium novyi A str. 4552 TaxID=1444289 RepID=A0A0A0I8Q7_CLONO|nr:hydroxyethylthiazole kinase [Clostridium novyi]KGM97839.1 hydroxyethylthiazole kinase [Clostridium novyi A str. 4552]